MFTKTRLIYYHSGVRHVSVSSDALLTTLNMAEAHIYIDVLLAFIYQMLIVGQQKPL